MTDSSSNTKKKGKYYIPPTFEKMTKAIIPDDNNTIPDKLKNLTDKDTGMISIRVDQKTIPLVSSSLYSDYTACPREYMANEARQVRKAIEIREKLLKKAKNKDEKEKITKEYNAELWVKLDGFSRKLVIEGKNSMGMSVEDFDLIYRIIGRSGNFDGDESGQFGIGALSYLCLSDTLLFETWSRETNEKYVLASKNGYAFDVLPTDSSTLNTYGTKCTITINPDINLAEILNYIKEVGRFLRCPVYLQTSGNISHDGGLEPNRIKKLGHIDFKEHLLGTKEERDEGRYSYINIDNDDYELHGAIAGDYDWKAPELLLVGIPINYNEIPIPPGFLINIKNERKYQPMSSRDGFSTKTTTAFTNRLREDLKNFFMNIKFDTLDEIRNSPYKTILMNIFRYAAHRNGNILDRFVNFEDSCPDLVKLIRFLNQKISAYTSDTLEVFGKSDNMTILDAILLNKKIIYSTKRDSLATYSVLNNNPNTIVLVSKFMGITSFVELLNKYKIEHINDYIYNNNITVPKSRTYLGVYTYNILGRKKIIHPNNMDSNYIKIPKKHKLQEFLTNIQCYDNIFHDNIFHNLMFCKETTKLADTKAISFGDIKNTLKDTLFNTSDGVINGIQICKKYDYKSIILICDISTDKVKKHKDVITIEKCKKVRQADLVIFINNIVDNQKQIQYLLLYLLDNYVYNNNSENLYLTNKILKTHDVGSYIIPDILNMSAVEHLGVDLIGSWYNKPDEAQKHLSQIKTPALRKLYARFVDSNISWEETNLSDIVIFSERGMSVSYMFSTLDKYYTSNPEKYKTDDDVYFDLLSREHYIRINVGDKNVTLWLVATIIDEMFYPGVPKTLFLHINKTPTQEFNILLIKKYQKLLDEMYKRKIILNKLKITNEGSEKGEPTIITFPANKLKHMDINKYSQLHMVLWAGAKGRTRANSNDSIKSVFFDNIIQLTIPKYD